MARRARDAASIRERGTGSVLHTLEGTTLREADLRELMAIPASYKVLFLQGGASSQFAMVPINLLRGKRRADYINTGSWSKKK